METQSAQPRAKKGRRKDVDRAGPQSPWAQFPPAPARAQRPRKPFKVSQLAVDQAQVRRGQIIATGGRSPFDPYLPAKGVLPPNVKPAMAMDDAGAQAIGWAQSAYTMSGAYAEGQMFLGFPELSILAQRPEYRLISGTFATEMTRKWIKFKARGDGGDKSDKIAKIEAEFKRLGVREAFSLAELQDGFFGRGHIYLDMGDTEDQGELMTNLGEGHDLVSRSKVSPKRPLRAIRNIEPIWTYPTAFNANDPLRPDWYMASMWYVMGKQIHPSRLLTFIGRPVPDLLKPAYAFGGLSLSQMAKPYVDNWLTTRQSVQNLLKSFTQFVIKTNMGGVLTGGGGDDFFKRVDMFNATRDNCNTMVIDKETEDFANVSAPLSGLDHLQAQAQEHCASIARIPLVKYTGISPSGLNASSDGELRCWGDQIHSDQESHFGPNLDTVLSLVQLSLFGEVDSDIEYEFQSIYELTEKEKAELQKTKADTGNVFIEAGVISQQEERKRIATDTDTSYAGLDVNDMPDLGEEEAEGLMQQAGHGGGDHAEAIHKLFGGPDAANENAPTRAIPAPQKQASARDMALDVEWEESKHKQGEGGKFAKGSTGETPKTAPQAKEEVPAEGKWPEAEPYQLTEAEKKYASAWGEHALTAHDIVKGVRRLNGLQAGSSKDTKAKQAVGYLTDRASLLASKYGVKASDDPSKLTPARAVILDMLKASNDLKQAMKDDAEGERYALGGAASRFGIAAERFEKFTMKEAKAFEKRTGASKPKPGSKGALLAEAQEKGAKVRKSWTKTQILESLARHFGVEVRSEEKPTKPGMTMNNGKKLAESAADRKQFDALLSEFANTCTASQLRDIAAHLPGIYVHGTKAAIVKQMHNWQREVELNDDIHAAQEKVAF